MGSETLMNVLLDYAYQKHYITVDDKVRIANERFNKSRNHKKYKIPFTDSPLYRSQPYAVRFGDYKKDHKYGLNNEGYE